MSHLEHGPSLMRACDIATEHGLELDEPTTSELLAIVIAIAAVLECRHPAAVRLPRLLDAVARRGYHWAAGGELDLDDL